MQNNLDICYFVGFVIFLKQHLFFSPSEGPCCTEECEFAPPGPECSETTECKFATNCTGKSSTCPIALFKSDSSKCESGSKVLYSQL